MVSTKKLLQVELNEFDPIFLREQANKLGLKHTLRFLDFEHGETFTDDEVEHQGLDPWVQWVNVHSGMPSSQHGIKRLGDTLNQTQPQIWEAIAEKGNRWVVWGVMNAPIGKKTGGEIFMPDPWSFDEEAYPENLNDLLSLPRYVAKNYLEPNRLEFTKRFLHLVRYYAPPTHWPVMLKFIKEFAKSTFTVGLSIHSLSTLLDYLGALEFVRYRKNTSPEFSIIFLNHIAHLQHQFWPSGEDLHPEMAFGLKINNLIMGLLLDSCNEDEAIIVMNGLKQENVAGKGFYVYRQINPERTIKELTGIDDILVEQCMTNDAHIKFKTAKDAGRAFERLSSLELTDGHKLFFTEMIAKKHVFIQLSIEYQVCENAEIICGNKNLNFYDLFEVVCERTGAHIPNGDVYYKGIQLKDKFFNHEIYANVMKYFDEPEIASTNHHQLRA